MRIKSLFYFVLFTLLWLTSCRDPEAPESDEFSEIGLIKTAVFNDENADNVAQAGETVTYTFTVQNTGTMSLSNPVLNDVKLGITGMPFEMTVLAPGQNATLTYTYTLTFTDVSEGSLTNQAEVTAVDENGNTVTDLSDDNSFSEDDMTVTQLNVITEGAFTGGYFVCNQGNYGQGNATLTYVNPSGEISQNVYQQVNGESLGDTAQSMYFAGNNGYIVVNNSHKVIVVNRHTLEKITEISGTVINNPRYFIAEGNTGYISNWGDAQNPNDDFIAVLDLNTHLVTGTISVGEGPENMIIKDGKLYVNLKGGWGYGHEVTVVDISDNTVINHIDLGADVPNGIIEDANGDLLVLCGGKPSWTQDETNGRIVRISGGNITASYDFETGQHPDFISLDGGSLYFFMGGKVYAMAEDFSSYSEVSGMDGFYYYMTANAGKLYTLDAGDYASEGTLKVFDLSSGNVSVTYDTGIIPGYVAFNE
jgi:hypothetical protein